MRKYGGGSGGGSVFGGGQSESDETPEVSESDDGEVVPEPT